MNVVPLLFSVLLGTAHTAGTVKPLDIGQHFVQTDAAQLPVCRTFRCRLLDADTTADKFTGENQRTEYRFEATPAPTPATHLRFSVIVDHRHIIQGLSLDVIVPPATPVATYAPAVLTWGQSVGLTRANLAPCLMRGIAVSGSIAFAGLNKKVDGGCSTPGGTQRDVRFFIAAPITFP